MAIRRLVLSMFVAAGILSTTAPLRAATPLFPTALHIVRRIDDPLAHRSVTVNEYCLGDRIVTFEIVTARNGRTEKIEAGVDRQIGLSRAAAEALLGAAYPSNRTDEHDTLLNLAAPQLGGRATTNAVTTDQYGLISEQTITYESEGSVLVVKSSVLAVDAATVPPDALLIDPGATRVESRLTRVQKELHDIDQLPSRADKP